MRQTDKVQTGLPESSTRVERKTSNVAAGFFCIAFAMTTFDLRFARQTVALAGITVSELAVIAPEWTLWVLTNGLARRLVA